MQDLIIDEYEEAEEVDYYYEEVDDDSSSGVLQYECLQQTSLSVYDYLRYLALMCLVYRALCYAVSCYLQRVECTRARIHTCLQVITVCFGVCTFLCLFEARALMYPCGVMLMSFIGLRVLPVDHVGFLSSLIVVAFQLFIELFIAGEKEWHRIRGVQMILTMKLISVAFDAQHRKLKTAPSLVEYCGYCLHPGSVVFGPWISYTDYRSSLANVGEQKTLQEMLLHVKHLLFSLVRMLVYVNVSSCVVDTVVSDTRPIYMIAVRDALSFRCSHYFISATSEFTLLLTGVNHSLDRRRIEVVNVRNIELPRSFKDIVNNWNLPMHYWLKNYVFRPFLFSNKLKSVNKYFIAFFVSYLSSSILHGLSFQLMSVLISLLIFQYIEFKFREKVSKVYSVCVKVKPCTANCEQHSHKKNSLLSRSINLAFTSLLLVHLAYLGFMFNSSQQAESGYSWRNVYLKWREVYFSSHVIAFIMFMYTII